MQRHAELGSASFSRFRNKFGMTERQLKSYATRPLQSIKEKVGH